MAGFDWTEAKLLAAQLIAQGKLSDEEIASKAGVVRSTVWTWRQAPEFRARVREELEQINECLRERAISHPGRRVARLNRDWLRLQQVIEERADAPEMQQVPGGRTGLLSHLRKPVRVGDGVEWLDTYAVDTAVLKELREHERQAAIELGQWDVKVEVRGAADMILEANRRRAHRKRDREPGGPPG